MPQEPRAWSRSPWILAAIAVLVVALALLVVRGVGDDDGGSGDKEASSDAPTSQEPTTTPGSEPSSGPTKVPPPGSLDPVPVGEVTTAPPVGLDATADFGTGVTMRIVEINPVDGVARGQGEISGPALQMVLEATNDSAKAISLEGVTIAGYYGAAQTPAMSLSKPGGAPFEGVLKAGDTARGVYLFVIPEADRGRIEVTASYTGRAPTLIFRGDAA